MMGRMLALIGLFCGVALAADEVIEAAMNADDVCASEDCSLELRQLRGELEPDAVVDDELEEKPEASLLDTDNERFLCGVIYCDPDSSQCCKSGNGMDGICIAQGSSCCRSKNGLMAVGCGPGAECIHDEAGAFVMCR
eukprot:TRINITY_DN8910_c0_g1_i1.p1 TRINITY_DN8910_c0_g1~~TRINITY_DN8910_c0_g1_i1.p1  ORF type:complete len:138 (+),score=32.17 TRINITY_DN8910_c0_g1_i1:64-477(+)